MYMMADHKQHEYMMAGHRQHEYTMAGHRQHEYTMAGCTQYAYMMADSRPPADRQIHLLNTISFKLEQIQMYVREHTYIRTYIESRR